MQKIKMFQTAAGDRYDEMLAISGIANRPFCRAQNIAHETYTGLKRGYFPWHATFNRIIYLKEQIDAGYTGWIFYLDADAYVYGMDIDLHALIDRHDGDFIFGPGGLTGARWDVNAGVFLINLGSQAGRELAQRWYDHFMGTPDAELRMAASWGGVHDDQERLHDILRSDPKLDERLIILPRAYFNDQLASFVRQVLRSNAATMDDRIAKLKLGVSEAVNRFTNHLGGSTDAALSAMAVGAITVADQVVQSPANATELVYDRLPYLRPVDALGLAHRYAANGNLPAATVMAELSLSDRQALGQDQTNALVLLASLRERQGQLRHAMEAITAALALSPGDEGVTADRERIGAAFELQMP